tara:strand:- start:96 stop:1709 length:1614 start_codon:yes stop_codon:yes gene_type:complete
LDFFSLENLRLVYRKELSLAKAHVQAQKNPNNGNALTKEKRNRMLELNIDCVHCGTLLSGNNYNTEHILDLSLGGENTVDNKMLMCKICNSARAELKVSLLGNQPTMAKWDLVEAYVLWSFITVDHGHASGANIPQVHQEFLRLASGGRERERSGTRWFARASNTSLSVSSGANGIILPRPTQGARLRTPFSKAPSSKKRLSLVRFPELMRWIKGSHHDHQNRPKAQGKPDQTAKDSATERPTATQPAPINQTQTSSNTRTSREESNNETPDLRSILLQALPHNTEVQTTRVNGLLGKFPELNGMEFRALATKQGYPKSSAMHKVLKDVFGSDISFPYKHNRTFVLCVQTEQNDANVVALGTRAPGEFVQFMKNILTYVPQSLVGIGVQIEQYLVEQNSPHTSTSHFLSLHGIPKGLKKAIETHLGDEVEITGEAPQYYVSLKREPPKFPDVDPEFQRHVLTALNNNDSELLLSAVSPILSTYLESIGLEKKSFKQFAKSYGIPLARTSVEIIHHYFRGSIAYRNEGKTVVYIWLVK